MHLEATKQAKCGSSVVPDELSSPSVPALDWILLAGARGGGELMRVLGGTAFSIGDEVHRLDGRGAAPAGAGWHLAGGVGSGAGEDRGGTSGCGVVAAGLRTEAGRERTR
jgi:hypothetical protein